MSLWRDGVPITAPSNNAKGYFNKKARNSIQRWRLTFSLFLILTDRVVKFRSKSDTVRHFKFSCHWLIKAMGIKWLSVILHRIHPSWANQKQTVDALATEVMLHMTSLVFKILFHCTAACSALTPLACPRPAVALFHMKLLQECELHTRDSLWESTHIHRWRSYLLATQG